MARPHKNNADYFPHDADASADEKLVYIESIMGPTGYALYFKTLETLTRADHFRIDWNPVKAAILARKYGVTPDTMQQFIVAATTPEIRLLTIENDQLHSPGLTKRLTPLLQKRQNDAARIAQQRTEIPQKPIIAATTPQNPATTPHSKVKESKEKEREKNARAHEEESEKQKTNTTGTTTPPDLTTIPGLHAHLEAHCTTDAGLHELKTWKRLAGYRDSIHGDTTVELTKYIAHYLPALRTTDPIQHLRDHFPAWLARATEYNRPKKPPQPNPRPNAAPPPQRRTTTPPPNATSTTLHIGDIAGKTITEFAP